MSLDNISAVDLARTNTAVVWSLGTGETTDGPAIRSVVHVEKGVLLLQAEPGSLLLVSLHELVALIAVVVGVGGAIGVPALANNQDVWALAEGVREDGDGAEIDI